VITDKEAEAEYTQQHELLRFPQVKAIDDGQRDNEDNYVCNDVAGCIDIPERKVRNTFAVYRISQPEFLDPVPTTVSSYYPSALRARQHDSVNLRGTGKDNNQELTDRPEAHEEESNKDDLPHHMRPQYAIILKEKADLRRSQRTIVQDNGDVKCLGRKSA